MENGTSALCLACSASFTPNYKDISVTECCKRPICHKCIAANPRLTRYNPCLMCSTGVNVVGARNFDGALRDHDIFTLGEDESEGGDDGNNYTGEGVTLGYPPGAVVLESSLEEPPGAAVQSPSVYHIKQDDTLQGIALRFGGSGRELCLLNNLPPSTLTTTPHLLHTRTTLLFPTYLHSRLAERAETEPEEKKKERERERAEKQLQTLTKEADWRIARAYVALASDSSNDDESLKLKEAGSLPSDILAAAAQKYLDDDEWEREQGGVMIQGFPYFKSANNSSSRNEKGQ